MKQIATRLTALLLALVMTTTLAFAANKSGYSDVPDKNWASQSIAQCRQYNLLQGIGNGKFGLGQKMTRAAYAAALCRLMGWKTVTPEKGSYTDNQNAKKWYYSAIETASAHDVFSGHSTTCRPNDPITREEMAAMTVRALGYSTLSGTVQDECPFTDVSTNPGYITLAWRMGLVVGMNLTTFAPKNDTTREQAAAVLLRAFLGTHLGLSLRATGDNPDMVRASSLNPAFTISVGLCLANAMTGLAGAIVGQYQKTVDINSGTGIVVIGLACLIIGETVLGRRSMTRGVLAALVGSLIYRFIYAVVFYTKIVPVECLKLLTAIIVALAIAAPSIQRWAAFQRRKAAAKGKGGN